MKKVINCAINSVILFVTYFITAFLILLILQVPMRFIFEAGTKLEFLWKTIVQYACMVVVCVGFLLLRNPEHKVEYLKHIENGEWNFRDACLYTSRNKNFWINSVGFAIWPVLIPKYFGAINLLYASEEFLNSFPTAIFVIFTVDVPFVIFSFAAWLIVTRYWSKTRMHRHKEQNE